MVWNLIGEFQNLMALIGQPIQLQMVLQVICVYAIAIDAQGNKWFGTYGGVSKFDGTNWTNYTLWMVFQNNYVWAIAIDAQDNKWFGTNDWSVKI